MRRVLHDVIAILPQYTPFQLPSVVVSVPMKVTALPEDTGLLTVTVAEAVARLPAASLATALTVWLPLASVVVSQLAV